MKKLTKKERHLLIYLLLNINQYWYKERDKNKNAVASFILDETELLIEKLDTSGNDYNCFAGTSKESSMIYKNIKKMIPPECEELDGKWFLEWNNRNIKVSEIENNDKKPL